MLAPTKVEQARRDTEEAKEQAQRATEHPPI